MDCDGECSIGLPLLLEGAAHWHSARIIASHTHTRAESTEHYVDVQDTAYVNPCFSETKNCGVPDYLSVDDVDETWCNCDLVDVCPVSRAPCSRAAPSWSMQSMHTLCSYAELQI